MVKTSFLTFFIYFGLFFESFAQSKAKPEEEEGISTKTLAYGVTTNNYSSLIGGVVLRSSTPLANRNGRAVNRYIAVEAINLKNPREKNIQSPYGSKFIFGKANYFFSLRPEYGREFYIFKKDGENSIGFSAIFAAGPSFGIEKPYYIKYTKNSKEPPKTVRFDPEIHVDKGFITGAGSIFQNMFTGLQMIPGAHIKAAANIDMSTFNNNVTGFEAGTVIEFFAKEPEIIASKFSKNPQAFATVYLTLYFGNKKLIKKKKA